MPSCAAELLRVANVDDARRLRDLITEANRHNVTFYPVNPGGLAVFDEPLSVRSSPNPNASPGQIPIAQDHARLTSRVQTLRTLAENTDGLAVVDTNDLSVGLRRVANDVSAYYLLGYYSTNTKLDGNYHRIQVKMKRPGVTVKARRGYFAPSEAAVAAASPTPASIAAAAAAALIADALNALARVRPSAELFVYGARRAADPPRSGDSRRANRERQVVAGRRCRSRRHGTQRRAARHREGAHRADGARRPPRGAAARRRGRPMAREREGHRRQRASGGSRDD
jgi:hypothetical protein